ncbi:MAG: glycosyltransferase family 39 protein [Candidatus Eisenbacteria bacterium]
MVRTASTHRIPLAGPQLWGLAFAMLVALALRLFHLGHQSLWVDEIFTWKAAIPHGPFGWADLLDDTHGPLVSGFMHIWIALFGDSEFVLRLPMALATTALVPAVAVLARRAAGDRAFLAAAWLTALSPFVTWYGQELRNYAFVLLWATLALDATLAYRVGGRSRDLAKLVLWSALGILSNLNGLFLLPVTFGALLAAPPHGRSRVAPIVLAFGALAIVLSPWILRYLGVFEIHRLLPGREALPAELPLRGATTFAWPAVPFTFYVFSVGYSLGPSLRALHEQSAWRAIVPHLPVIGLTGVVFGALALTGLAALGRRRFARAVLAGSIVLPLACVAYFAVMNFKPFNPRYLAVALPAWFVLIAAGYTAWLRPVRLMTGVFVLGLFGVSLFQHYGHVEYAKEDFRSAASALASRIAPGDSLVLAGGCSPLDYYRRLLPPAAPRGHVYWLGYAADARMETRFAPLLNTGGGATWVVVSRPEDLDPGRRFEPWLVATYHPEVLSFTGVRIYRISPRLR